LEQENVTMDMENLSVSLVAGGKEQLKGNFTLMCIYTREVGGSTVSETNAPTQLKPESSKPESSLAISPDM
ncbi:MAG: hypothetical protein KKF10_01295, partial [Verrucomicrobia bacterium]|nr:hypothetical protein [Verrucomicrobiota bacterium]